MLEKSLIEEYQKKFRQVKGLIIACGIHQEEAKLELGKIIFGLRTFKRTLIKEEHKNQGNLIHKIDSILEEIISIKSIAPELFEDNNMYEMLVEELKDKLNENIETENLEVSAD